MIFGLFDKLNPHSEGTGVGLALAQRIVKYMAEGQGRGSVFCFTLPGKENTNEV